MQPNAATRRVHSAELKAAVLAACEVPGASISAVALAHGLNTNLVRKWRVGRGLKRSGLRAATTWSPGPGPEGALLAPSPAAPPARPPRPAPPTLGMEFVPVERMLPLAPSTPGADSRGGYHADDGAGAHAGMAARLVDSAAGETAAGAIHIELQRGQARLSVHWPASDPSSHGHCAAWLRELACAVLK